MTGFNNPYQESRPESVGEADQRFASWLLGVLKGWPIKLEFRDSEEDGYFRFMRCVTRRWPQLRKWKAPTKVG